MAVGTTNVSMTEIRDAFNAVGSHGRDRIPQGTPQTFSSWRGVRLSDGSFIPSSGEISISQFRGKGPFVPWETESQYNQPSPSYNYQKYGYSVSYNGDGSRWAVSSPDYGGGYIFVHDIASPYSPTKLSASQTTSTLGYSVAISKDGNYIAAGDTVYDSSKGAVFIFNRAANGTWSQFDWIMASDAQNNDSFGESVDISDNGEYIAVGSPYEDVGGSNKGAVYVFKRSGSYFSQQVKLQRPSGTGGAGDQVGRCVSISGNGDKLVTGGPFNDTGATNTGRIYYFTRSGSTWTHRQSFQHPDASAYDNVGLALAISGDGNTLVVGVKEERKPSPDVAARGRAYVYTRSGTTWTHRKSLNGYDSTSYDYFGTTVAISDDGIRVAVGAPNGNQNTSWAGAVYLFEKYNTNWTLVGIHTPSLVATDATANANLSHSLAMSADGYKVIAGAPYKYQSGASRGAVYTFE